MEEINIPTSQDSNAPVPYYSVLLLRITNLSVLCVSAVHTREDKG